jgi:NCS1 family nucleobase:cation symporter-1
MVSSVSSGSIHINVGLRHLFDFNWLYGFVLSIAIYYMLNAIFPDRRSLIAEAVHGIPTVLEGVVIDVDGEKGVLEYDQEKTSKEVRSRECFV